MKILKWLAIFVGCLLLVGILIAIIKKAARTRIELTGFDATLKTVTVSVYANDRLTKTYTIPVNQLSKTSVMANDYRVETGLVGTLVPFRVVDDRNQEVAVTWFDFNKPQKLTIFSE